MLEFIRISRRMSTSKPSSLRSSMDESPSKAPSLGNPGQSRASSISRPVPTYTYSHEAPQAAANAVPLKSSAATNASHFRSLQTSHTPNPTVTNHPQQSSSHFPQSSSGISKASPSFVAAHGEFLPSSQTAGISGNRSCVGQLAISDEPRGSKNPHGISLDKSSGYLSQDSDAVSGSSGPATVTQLNDRPSLDDLLRIIAAERLHHMPQKGSNWDRSIRTLESFALKVSSFASRHTSVVGNAQLTARMLYGRCSSLLQLGRNQATSLVPAIGLLAEVSPVLSLFTGFPRQSTSGQLQRQLGQVFDRTLDVLDGMTSYFQDLSIGLGTATGPSGLRSSLSKQLEAFDLQAEQLRNEIWNDCSPSNADEPDIHFEQIRQLLQPQDEVVRSTQKILLGERSSRHEFTCEWFSKPFLDFVRSSDSAVWVDGRIGCGKSVLYGWILESLESPLDGREYAVIAHAIDPLLPSETNIVCVIKTLLWHLIKRQYGPGNMHKALVKLATTVKTGGGSFDVESALWECLQIAIGDALQPTMIVIDGLSEIDGGEATATALFQKLLNSVEGNPSVRLLVLSRPFTFSPIAHLRRRNIEGRDVHKDIRRVITDWVPSGSLTPSAEVARRIDHEADGNFFWSLLAFQEWKAHNFSLQTWRDLPTSLDTIVAKLISRIDLSDPTTGTIFFSSIIARRPLRVSEVEHLLRLDTDTKTLKAQAPDVTRAIEEGCMSVLVVQDGIVLFRHALLKQGVLDSLRTGTRSIAPELHANMALRLLLYLKIVLGQRSELTLKLAPSSAIEDLLHGHPLLPYALRYWVSHVGASPSESFQANTGLKTFFPDTIHAATVEASFWIQNLTHESLRNLSIAAKVRNAILGSQEATLQTISLLAEALRSTKDFTGAALEFGVALELAQDILPEFHSFTATCMLKFLHVIDFADANEISDLSSRKADVLRYVISMYDTQIGPSSDQSIQYRYSLAGHYAHVQDFALSAEMYKDIHRLNIERHGKDSSEARLSAERVMTALQSPSEEGPNRYSDAVYDDILRTYDVTDARRIKASMAKAETYKAFDDLFNAELVYIGLWHGVAEACHRQKTLENHERLLETGIAYAQFLRENNRFSDAQTVLLGLRSQQSAVKYKSDTTINLLEQVAAEMKHAGLQDMALEILRDVLAWSETDADSGINKAISDITLEMARGAKSDISSNTALELSPTDASEVNPVISKLIDGHRFADVIAFASKTLYGLWPAIVHRHEAQTPTALDRFDPDLVKLAASLAHAYVKTDNIEEAASIYWYLFQTTRHPDAAHHDTTAAEYGDLAFDAFSQTGEIDRSIAVREDLVDYHITKCGRDHSSTIESLYALASLYMQEHLFEKAKRQYSQIADTLKRSGQPDFHLPAAIPALRRLIEIYSRERSFDNALKVYSWLWNTFMVKGSEFGLESSAAKRVYKDYTGLLRRLDSTKIHVVTESYRSLCLALWGERDEATLEASLLLADSWNSQKRVTEAIKLYEWLVDGHDDVQQESSRAIVEAAESRLTDLYQTDISDDAQTITRAVRLQGKRYEKEKTSQDPSHLTTLSSLAIWISVLTKEGSSDSRVVAVGELQLAINAIIESDAQPSSLYSAAVLLATSFSANGYVEEGLRTVQRLTEQVVFQEGESDQRARRSNLVFLTAFEAHLTGSTMDFAEIHAKVLLESALWESYKRLGQEDAEPGMTLAYGARLRTFLVKHNAFDRAAFIERDLFERFMDHYGEAFTRGIQSARGAFLLLVQELSEERLQFDIPTLATAALVKNVGSQLEEGHYQSALDLAFPGFEFIQFVGAFTCGDNSSLVNGLELGLMLACVDAAPAPDHTTATQLLELSKSILQETLRECRSQNFNLNVVSIDLISRVASVLGLQQNYEYLEWLLTRVWLSRNALTSVSQDVIIQIGRRLVEVRFYHGHIDSAIELGEDIFYNVQRVYGTSHPSTVDMASVLSSMYLANGDEAAAKAVLGDASQLKQPDPNGSTTKASPQHPAESVKSNLEHLLHFYQRNEGTNTSRQSVIAARYASEGVEHSNDAGNVVRTGQQPPMTWGFH